MCQACPIIDWAELLPAVQSFTARRVTDTMADFIVWFDRYEQAHKPLVGGKNASLGEMMVAEADESDGVGSRGARPGEDRLRWVLDVETHQNRCHVGPGDR